MTRRPSLRLGAGLIMLALAAGAVSVARGTADAANAFRDAQAEWQRGLQPAPAASRGLAQRTGESLLGIRARSDVLRTYQDYRVGVANLIPGTAYPQTRARFEAVKSLDRLRASLHGAADRASADVVLGVVLTDGASTAGPQREAQLAKALAAFSRAVREDPLNATAKLDLEVLLRATAPKTKSRPRPSGTATRQRQSAENPRNPRNPPRTEGNGF